MKPYNSAMWGAASFTIVDGLGDPIMVNTIGDLSQQDNELELSTDDFSLAVGDLQVTYNDDGDADRIIDFGSNFLMDGATATVNTDSGATNDCFGNS